PTCNNACEFHSRLIQNMLKVLAQKNLFMNNKITYLTLKGMRQKIASYLLSQIEKTGKDRFEIPYSRTELADFLNVDRSAMSRELSRMKKEGLIDFNRNTFSVLDKQALCDLV
ncbi:MAG: helix-turn-helix domain-containing protein, partial [[Clostridium] cellulosi]